MPKFTAHKQGTGEAAIIKYSLIFSALLFLAVFLVLPLGIVFYEAFASGWKAYLAALNDPDTLSALSLTLTVIVFVVPLNVLFGLAAAWSVTKHEFPGKSVLVTLIDLPFSVSPVVAGLSFVMLFGAHGWFGNILDHLNLEIIFATPGIILATIFVTFPFVVRELITLMESQGNTLEEAALSLGASGWRTFFAVTLPNVKWALFYGVLLCSARAMGDFGAVSVVSGHIRGVTNTLPLQVEVLYNEYAFSASFAVASLLAILALFSLLLKSVLEWRHGEDLASGHRS